MRRTGIFAVLLGLLVMFSACGSQEEAAWEYVGDEAAQVLAPEPGYDLRLVIPAGLQQDASLSWGENQVYTQEDGELTLTTQILRAEDLKDLLKDLTGQDMDGLTVMTTWQEGLPRHEASWVCAGERGLEVCRGVILDDGSYYYAVTTSVLEASAESYAQQIADCLSQVRLTKNLGVTVTAP